MILLVSYWKHGDSDSYSINKIIAYILAGGSDTKYGSGYYGNTGTYTARQLCLWYEWNTFVNKYDYLTDYYDSDNKDVKEEYSTQWSNTDADELLSAAESYDDNYSTQYAAKISADSTSISLDAYDLDGDLDGSYVGPFNVTYTYTINSYTVYDSDGDELDESSYSFYKKNSSGTYSQISSIPNGTDFYVLVSDYNISKIVIEVRGYKKRYNVDIAIYECSKIESDGKYTKISQIQDLIKVTIQDRTYETASVTINVSIDKPRKFNNN